MAWFSILPESLSYIETWAIRIFLFLGMLSIGPWLLFLIYDIVLYVFRAATYDIPYIGGRARNRPRPRAPSLSERPSGRPRTFSLNVPGTTVGHEGIEEAMDGLKQRMPEWRGHKLSRSEGSNPLSDN